MKKHILMLALVFVSTAATGDWAVRGEGNYSCPEYVADAAKALVEELIRKE